MSGQRQQALRAAATIINGMRAQKIGRVLGIGVRVAGRIAGQWLAGSTQTTARAPHAPQAAAVAGAVLQDGRAAAQKAAQVAGQMSAEAGRGMSRGAAAFLRPFRRVGSILWLEVTGVFFLLPVIVFTPYLWRYRASFLHGPDHRTFVVSACVVLVFLYLGVSSFWRARQRSKDAQR
jgi:hypothetical protein